MRIARTMSTLALVAATTAPVAAQAQAAGMTVPAHEVSLRIDRQTLHQFGGQSQETQLDVTARLRVRWDGDTAIAVTVLETEIVPTSTSGMTFMGSRDGDVGVTFEIPIRPGARPGPVAVPPQAGPVARFLLMGVPFAVLRRLDAGGEIVDTVAWSDANEYAENQAVEITRWSLGAPDRADSLVAVIEGTSSGTSTLSDVVSQTLTAGSGWMVVRDGRVVAASIERQDKTTGDSASGGFSSTSTTTITVALLSAGSGKQ